MSLPAELQPRNVIRMAGLYLVGAWLVMPAATTLLPVFEARRMPEHPAFLRAMGPADWAESGTSEQRRKDAQGGDRRD